MNEQNRSGVGAGSETRLKSAQKPSMNRAENSCDLSNLKDRWEDKEKANP